MVRIVDPHHDDLPAHIGPAEFSTLGALVAVRCPHDLDPLMQRAGGLWEPGTPALADRAAVDQSADAQPAAHDRSAVSAAGHRPGREAMTRIVTSTSSMLTVVAMAAFLLAGCVAGEQISHIDVGMSREQVIGILGRPDGDRRVDDSEAMTYSNRLMSGWSWDRADYQVVFTNGRVSAYGPGVVRQNSGPSVLMIVPLR